MRGFEWYGRVGLVCAAVVLALVGAAPGRASAASRLFASPVEVASGAFPGSSFDQLSGIPRVMLGSDGSATVAWAPHDNSLDANGAQARGLFVSQRRPAEVAFSPPIEITDHYAANPVIAENDGRVRAIAWIEADPETHRVGSVELSVAPAGGSFGAPEAVPIPARADPVDDGVTPDSRFFEVGDVAVAPSGAVLVSYLDTDRRGDNSRAVVVLRTPAGTWGEPQVLDQQAALPAVVAADPRGGFTALWPAPPHDGSTKQMRLLYGADAGPDGLFGADQMLSEPDKDAWNGPSPPSLLSNRGGDMLAVWRGAALETAIRISGGAWSHPHVLSADPRQERPTGALDDHGNALVAWTDSVTAYASYGPVGASWQPVTTAFTRQGTSDQMPAAFDAYGTGLVASAACRSAGTIDTVVAFTLPPGSALQPATQLSAGTDPVSRPQVATDPYGNGLVVWTQGNYHEPQKIVAAAYSAGPPSITKLRAQLHGVTFRIDKPARVTITVRSGRRGATQHATVRPGFIKLRLRGTVSALARGRGAHRVTILARDAGPRPSRARTVTLKR